MNKKFLSEENIKKIRVILEKPDGIIGFPTDTVWGVGCLVENEEAVNRIYAAKHRSKSKPLILLGSKIEYLLPYVEKVNDKALEIIDKYLPGAVTLILPKSKKTPDSITSGFNTVGIRIPNHPVFLEILEQTVPNHVLATTSANLSGEQSGTNLEEVLNSIGNEVDYIVPDFGINAKGTASTIVTFDEDNQVKILRQGDIKIK